ncbi:hypothetical protein ENKNEFLB_00771 [Nocardioides aquaticus]|uniref:DUF1501 domain-containing protein n=1 Tax=Nocardioides aquaticus TaxID=160826 RepID=A0ABX8EDP5_9ACTN|nr:DUF1501 domain-containing protein [Nocardioides aquaticus]QVT78394.1 hypothetical protein ENKNEFLB_00771 [Nocardioides aquaticus]
MPASPVRPATPGVTPDVTCADAGCAGFTASRRRVLGGLALGGLTTITGSTVVTMSGAPALAAEADDDSVLVVLSLRGASDGLSLVVPHGDPAYYAARPRIAVPSDRLVAKDGFFGLHPSFTPLLPMWEARELAAVHATGLPVANRSHFAAMEELEDAAPGSPERSGWLNRLLGESGESRAVEGVAVGGGAAPTSLFGEEPILSYPTLAGATLAGDKPSDSRRTRRTALERMWASDGSRMGRAVQGAMSAIEDLRVGAAQANNAASYPRSDLGSALATVAQTLRGDLGTRLVTVDHGSWDMHSNLGTLAGGRLVGMADTLAASLAAFFDDLGSVRDRVTVVTISEFGRRVAENANLGLDHGWGNAMLVAGAGVSGGRYHGRWPGLQNTTDADLTVTTDYRSVLAEIVAARFPGASLPQVFPGFTRERVGVMTGQ